VGKKASYEEICKKWTIKDLLDCHELMDIELEAEEYRRKHPEEGRS
jgi:hypothetical protein